MHRPLLLVALLLLVSAPLTGCGDAQNRPVVLSTIPPDGAEFPVTLSEVRVTFDDPVTILNQSQIAVATGGVTIPVVAVTDEDDPRTIRILPQSGEFWRVGEASILLRAGWAVNDSGHYRLEDYRFGFTLGTALPVYFGVPAPASVVQTSGPDFTPVRTIPTPGAREPKGLICSTVGAQQRTWVQLADGGGNGEALGWFTVGDAVMASVGLTVEAGGDLVAERECLWVDRAGEFLYAAYRDTALGQVRLHKIAVATASEVQTLVLSPAASPTTSPQGLALTPDELFVDIACSGDAGARLVVVDLTTFAEVDLGPDPGVDGLPLPTGAGPTAVTNGPTLVAPLAETTAVLTTADLATLEVLDLESIVIGSPTTLVLTPDDRFVVEGVSGWVDDEAFAYRRRLSLSTSEEPVVIDDDTGAGNGAASEVLDIAWFTGSTRLIALLDNDAAIYLRFLPGGVDQEDLDETTPEAAVDLSAIAPGATRIAIPPPSVLGAP